MLLMSIMKKSELIKENNLGLNFQKSIDGRNPAGITRGISVLISNHGYLKGLFRQIRDSPLRRPQFLKRHGKMPQTPPVYKV